MSPKVEPPPAAPAAAEGAAAPAPVEAPKPEIAAPANPAAVPAAEAPKPELMLAGRFKSALPGVEKDPGVQELVKAYDASGLEARRLLKVGADAQEQVKAAAKAIAERDAQLEALKLEKQLGPEIVDPTEAESANWTPKQWADHSVAKMKREQLKEKLEAQQKASVAQAANAKQESAKEVFRRMDYMSAQKEEFPGFDDMMKQDENGRGPIADWVSLVPELSGKAIAPLALYLMAKGHESLQKDRAAAVAAKASITNAKELVAATLPAAAGAGSGPAPEPNAPKPNVPADDSDAGHNARLIASHSWTPPVLPID